MSLAFGDWCNCHDHNHLHDWLLSEADIKTSHTGADPLARQRLLEKISGIELQRNKSLCIVRAAVDSCATPSCTESTWSIVAPIDTWRREGAWLMKSSVNCMTYWLSSTNGKTVSDCCVKRRTCALRLTAEQPVQDLGGRFRELVHRHIAGLMGGRERFSSRAASRNVSEGMQRRYDLVDGIVYDQERRLEIEVPSSLVRVAQRLAIAEAMAARAEPVPVLIDEALDRLAHDEQAAAIAYLARIAAGQQIVLMTGNERVAELVRQRHGWVAYLQPHVAPAVDINRHLTALANDYEAAKWFQPNVDAEPLRSTSQSVPFYLTERSRIEQSPSIDGVLAARFALSESIASVICSMSTPAGWPNNFVKTVLTTPDIELASRSAPALLGAAIAPLRRASAGIDRRSHTAAVSGYASKSTARPRRAIRCHRSWASLLAQR
ncbi:MAG: hypothetical protein R3C56_26440 [Pirellulaceae bacterium]